MSILPASSSVGGDPDRDIPVETRLLEGLEEGTLPPDLMVCGAAGTGKTYGILTVLHCLARDYRDLRILIARQTRRSLTESVLVTFEGKILPRDGMEWLARGPKRAQRSSYVYPSRSEIVLAGLDNPDKALSTEWDIVYINEAIETLRETWQTLLARMNRPGRGTQLGLLLGDTNPGHPGHWIKAEADAGRLPMWDTSHKANPAMFDAEAGTWTEDGWVYREQLSRLSGTQRARFRDGLWAVGEGLWFDMFDPERHASDRTEADPALETFLSVDPGVVTGAVLFQQAGERVRVIADYLSEGRRLEANAEALKELVLRHAPWTRDEETGLPRIVAYADPAGGARNPIGPTLIEHYRRAGLPLRPWANSNPPIADSLANVETRLDPIGLPPLLTVHPRCRHLIDAFSSYRRAKQGGQWADWPEDPQHPAEDMIDALKGGLWARYPSRKPMRVLTVGRN